MIEIIEKIKQVQVIPIKATFNFPSGLKICFDLTETPSTQLILSLPVTAEKQVSFKSGVVISARVVPLSLSKVVMARVSTPLTAGIPNL